MSIAYYSGFGRPKVAPENKKTHIVSLRLKDWEKELIQGIAASEGIPLSRWLRKSLIIAIDDAKRNT